MADILRSNPQVPKKKNDCFPKKKKRNSIAVVVIAANISCLSETGNSLSAAVDVELNVSRFKAGGENQDCHICESIWQPDRKLSTIFAHDLYTKVKHLYRFSLTTKPCEYGLGFAKTLGICTSNISIDAKSVCHFWWPGQCLDESMPVRGPLSAWLPHSSSFIIEWNFMADTLNAGPDQS